MIGGVAGGGAGLMTGGVSGGGVGVGDGEAGEAPGGV